MKFKKLLEENLNEREKSIKENIEKKIIKFMEDKFEKELDMPIKYKNKSSPDFKNIQIRITENIDFKNNKYLSLFLKSLELEYWVYTIIDKIYVQSIKIYNHYLDRDLNYFEFPIKEIIFDLNGNFEKEVRN